MQVLYSKLIKALHLFAKEGQHQEAVIGLSGGLDSAVALCIAVRAFGAKKVTALLLPEIGQTPPEDMEHAKMLAKHFGCKMHYQPINNFLVDYAFVPWESSELARKHLRARARSQMIRHFAESRPALFIGTASKSDLLLGYGIEGGEFDGDVQVLGDLLKTQVHRLGEFIGLPQELLQKDPARRLSAMQTDESELGYDWKILDDAIQKLLEGRDPELLIQKGMDSLLVHKLARLMEENHHRFAKIPKLSVTVASATMQKAQAAEEASVG